MPKLLIMAGGTGGHVFPGLAVATHMMNLGWHIDWIGTADKMEAKIVPQHNIAIHFIDIGGVRGKSILTKLITPFKLLSALMQAKKILSTIKPDVVLGMGGYASGPGGLAAKLLGIPLVVHEQNAIFGMTNRYLAKIATHTLTGFDIANTKYSNKSIPANTQYVGNPIRRGFFDIKTLPPHSRINILLVGGSLGALALNQIVPPILLNLANKYPISVRHQSGKNKHKQVEQAYANAGNTTNVDVIEFIDNMETAFAWADIIICRAGALTVAEIAGAGRAAIFVPLPIAVDDHQTANAKYLSEKSAAVLIQQKDLQTLLSVRLIELCSDHKKLTQMALMAKQLGQQDATIKVSKVLQSLLVDGGKNASKKCCDESKT